MSEKCVSVQRAVTAVRGECAVSSISAEAINSPRIKVGIGAKPNPDWDLADWVLSKFTPDEMKKLDEIFDNAEKAIELIIDGKTDRAMNLFN